MDDQVAFCTTGAAHADPFAEGFAAYQAGDYAKAYRLWGPLAERGLPTAQVWLGVLYADGRGVRQDDAEAVRWFRKAASQNLAGAQLVLGIMYTDGRGAQQDDTEAARWYHKAAEQGLAEAQARLGARYLVGLGLPQDFVQAHMWFNLAASQGHDNARQVRDGLNLLMRAEQIAEAQRLARAWQARQAAPMDSKQSPTDTSSAFSDLIPSQRSRKDLDVELKRLRELVREAQGLLARLGFDPGPADGAAGARTRAAVEAYQRSRSLPVDGAVTAALVERLRQDRAAVAAAPAGPVDRSGEPAQTGTGFFVSADGHLLTNAHVVAGCARLRARDASGAGASVELLATAPREDLALLRAAMRPPAVATLRGGAPVRAGDDIVLFGFPLAGLLASSGNTTTGSVTALAGPGNDAQLLQISAPVQPGNSGGPVLDQGGSVVGIVVGKLDAIAVARATRDIPQNVNFAIKASVAANFLEAHAVGYATGTGNGSLAAADIADRARRFTVRVECYR